MEKSKRSARKEGSSNRYDPEEGSLPDIITEDGILCSILSHLRLREAVATCVLSPRWRQLWTNRHKLCFSIDTMFDSNTVRLICAQDTPLTQKEILELAKGKTIQFIQAVNSVLQQLKGCGEVDEFQLHYFLHRKHSHHLDAWVCFALKSNTKVLALYLHNPFHKEPVRRVYDFPFWLLGPPSSLEDLTLQCCSLKPPRKFDGLTNLKILKLYYIDLIEEDIICLLANCHTLEQLMLESSPRLRTLSVPHPLSQLNKLVVKDCHQLREININAINLRTLFYWGYPADIMLSQSSSSLEYLTLQCCSLKPLPKFDGLTNLKILKLYYIDLIEEDITCLLANCHTLEQLMLETSPRLRTLSIPHPLSQLNKLVVKDCHQLREININAINLRTLFYWGYPADIMLSQSSSSLEDLTLQCCSLKPLPKFDGLTNLKILKLDYIDLIEEDITCLLGNCHTLEQLMLESSPRLRTLSIPHPLSQLNKLVVKDCHQLREININAINLRTFFYWGYPADIMLSQSSSSLEDLTLQCCSLKPPPKFDGLTNLKILNLYYIDIIEEDITCFLANCHTLEQLMLESSPRLRTLSIPHSLSQLNKLVVKHCHQLREINIKAINLRTLFYWGYPADLMLSQSSQLEDVDILFKTESSDPTLDFYITQLFRNLPQLPSLVFRIAGNLGVSKKLKSPRGSNRFSRLTRLNWCWSVSVKMSLLDLATLMDAFPILEEFSLTLRLTKCMLEDPPTENLTKMKKCMIEDPPTENLTMLKKRIPEHPHTHLKTIEIVDFYYETWQIEIALYFFKNAIELQSITINEDRRGLDEMQRKKLSQLAPANVKFVIPVMNV